MKKIIYLIVTIMLLTGCSKISLQTYYDDMQINKIDSYELSLRIYGKVNNEDINEAYTIDNYKNSEYKITIKDNIYYILNNKTYKENITKIDTINPFDFENIFNINNRETKEYEEVTEELFTNTNLLLEGLVNSKSIKETEHKSDDYKIYELKLTSEFTDKLLSELNHNFKYKKSTATVYIYNNQVYKIVYVVDDLTISSVFTSVNKIEPLDLNV